MMKGLVHIYCGDGKGKTTAAVGLSIRAAGAGKKVLFVQFFKDGSSSEIAVLRSLENVRVLVCGTRRGFFKNMDTAERAAAAEEAAGLMRQAFDAAGAGVDLLVLDEIVSACNRGVVSEAELVRFLQGRPEGLEVVMTGRDPSEALLSLADYVTEMKNIRHPFDRGVGARHGIEY